MAALTSDRHSPRRAGMQLSLPAAAGAVIYAGAIVSVNAQNLVVPGAAGLAGVGIAERRVNNTGAAGDLQVPISRGVHQVANSGGGDQITLAHIGRDCYLVDDQTVALTDASGARARAGRIFDVDAGGVWVDFS